MTTPITMPALWPTMEEGGFEMLPLPNARDVDAAARKVCYVE